MRGDVQERDRREERRGVERKKHASLSLLVWWWTERKKEGRKVPRAKKTGATGRHRRGPEKKWNEKSQPNEERGVDGM